MVMYLVTSMQMASAAVGIIDGIGQEIKEKVRNSIPMMVIKEWAISKAGRCSEGDLMTTAMIVVHLKRLRSDSSARVDKRSQSVR